jgi:hypothetical protein
MSDEATEIILGDTAISAIERKSQRGWLRKRKGEDLPPFTHCENCGSTLTGHYCSQCGQAAIDYRGSFRHVIGEILETYDINSKIFGTAGLLVTRPWALTNEYLSGKRVRHLNPFKLYLFASIGFFFLVHYWTKDLPIHPDKISDENRADVAAAISEKRDEIQKELDQENLSPEQRRKAEAVLDSLTKPNPSSASAAPVATASPEASATGSPKESNRREYGAIGDRPFVFDDKPTTPFERWLEARAKEKMGEHGTKMGLFITTLFSNLPYMMFCCIPLFAFVLKVLYVRRRVFYIDHLIYALHIHSFFYTGVMLIVLITMGLDRVLPGALAGWLIALLWITFVVQIFLSIRYVYRQGWFISAVKFLFGGFVYFFVLLLALAATFFVTLAIPS